MTLTNLTFKVKNLIRKLHKIMENMTSKITFRMQKNQFK